MQTNTEAIDNLERLILEIDAMSSIICGTFTGTDGVEHSDFFVTTKESLLRAREYVTDETREYSSEEIVINLSPISVETFLHSDDQSVADGVRLRISLYPGYPAHIPAEVTVLSTPKDFPKSNLDALSTRLTNRANELIGCEAMMDVINECRNLLTNWKISSTQMTTYQFGKQATAKQSSTYKTSLSRRWIWVHHITNIGRIKQIVQEAQQLSLGGYVKGGYPGVIVIEGQCHACDEFVIWIKGNKRLSITNKEFSR